MTAHSTALRATLLNCTLKPSPEQSNTEAVLGQVGKALGDRGVSCETIRIVDHDVRPGVETDMGGGDAWPEIHERLTSSEILVVATPTWLGQQSSVCKRVLERMDAMLSESDDEGRPIALNRVAGVVVTGNEDGAHHVIAEVSGGLIDIGYTVPGQAWTYWNKGPGPGDSYLESDDEQGKEWTRATGEAAAANLVAVAEALRRAPIGVPPNAG
jgi:multimeric flavodoxin WrbA